MKVYVLLYKKSIMLAGFEFCWCHVVTEIHCDEMLLSVAKMNTEEK